MVTIGRELRRLRIVKGWGLRELARAANVSPAFLSSLETGHRPGLPSEATTQRLAKALGADADELLCAAGKLPAAVVEYLAKNPQIVAALRAEMATR